MEMNKKGFVDQDVLLSPGFMALAIGSTLAVVLGWKMSLNMDSGGFPLWQIGIIIVGCLVASYVFAARG